MAKGKTNQPLRILVTDPDMIPDISNLVAGGHNIVLGDIEWDLIVGPNAWFCTREILTTPGVLPAMLKTARKRKKGKKVKDEDVS